MKILYIKHTITVILFFVYHAGYYCPLGDSERLKRENKSQSIKDKRKEIVRQLEMLGDCVTEMELEYKRDLIAADSFIVEAYDTVGKEVIEKLKYSKKENHGSHDTEAIQ